MKKKLILIVLPILFVIICFSSTAEAMTTERGTQVDSDGLYTYVERFDDLSGALSVTTTFVNDSGANYAYITALAICMLENRTFRLRIYDSDQGEFVASDNEAGVGIKERRFEVEVHTGTNYLIWTAYVTNMAAEVIYAKISLHYVYDSDADFRVPGVEFGEGKYTEEEIKKERFWVNFSWVVVSIFSITVTGLLLIQTQGTGVKTFFSEIFKRGSK